MIIDRAALERNLVVIKNLQKMNEFELDAFMEEFIRTFDDVNINPNKLAVFMQLLLQMDSRLAERFMQDISDKDRK